MTCIVGIEHKGVVYLGGDSAGVGDLDIHLRVDEKVFRNQDFVMGFTTSFRMGQLLRYAFAPPLHHPQSADMAYLVTDFVDSIRQVYKDKGFLSVLDSEEMSGAESGGTFLFGYKGSLYSMQDDFQIAKTYDGFMACGCGEAYALGSLMSTKHIDSPLERLQMALEAASHFSAGVRGPYNFVSTVDTEYITWPIPESHRRQEGNSTAEVMFKGALPKRTTRKR